MLPDPPGLPQGHERQASLEGRPGQAQPCPAVRVVFLGRARGEISDG